MSKLFDLRTQKVNLMKEIDILNANINSYKNKPRYLLTTNKMIKERNLLMAELREITLELGRFI